MEPARQWSLKPPRYQRQRPEASLLYHLAEQHFPAFLAALGARGRTLPGYVPEELEAYLKCGRLEYVFLRVRCTACRAERLAKHAGFSLHAGVAAAVHQCDRVERLCRYMARPAVAAGRLALAAQGLVRYTPKMPYQDGTTHVVIEPQDMLARPAARMPRPRVHLTRYHDVIASHSALHAAITPAGRGSAAPATTRNPAVIGRILAHRQQAEPARVHRQSTRVTGVPVVAAPGAWCAAKIHMISVVWRTACRWSGVALPGIPPREATCRRLHSPQQGL